MAVTMDSETAAGLVCPREQERDLVATVGRFLAGDPTATALLSSPDGREARLPPTLQEVLRQATRILALGQAVAMVPVPRMLTTTEAADLLAISRPSLRQVLERGELPFTMVGTHRRIRLDDLLAFRAAHDARRRAALESLVQQSEELGLYERT